MRWFAMMSLLFECFDVINNIIICIVASVMISIAIITVQKKTWMNEWMIINLLLFIIDKNDEEEVAFWVVIKYNIIIIIKYTLYTHVFYNFFILILAT